MRLRFHHPLFAGFFGVIGLLVVAIVLLIGSGVRRELDTAAQRELRRELGLAHAVLAASARADVAALGQADGLARLITDRVGYRVTIIAMDGTVLGDSFVEPTGVVMVENHADRPEVREVLEGAPIAFAVRTSATVGEPLLYAAMPAVLGMDSVILRMAVPRTSTELAVDNVQRTVAVAGLVTMIFTLLAVYGLSKAFTRPLAALAGRAGVMAKGDFSEKLPTSRVAELNDLSAAFNRLTDELQARLAELGRERDEMQTLIDCMAEGVIALTSDARLLRMNRTARSFLGLGDVPAFAPIGTVIRDSALRAALEGSATGDDGSGEIQIGGRHYLLASRALDEGGSVTTILDISELRRLEEVRRDFVANASHELKTPLTAIRGFAETLVDSDPPDELRQQFLESIRSNTLRLQNLVDDLLDQSRLESGRWSAASEKIVVQDAVAEAWNLVPPRRDPPPELTLSGGAVVRGDHQGLVQIFVNLLDNAVRHTDEPGRITVSIEPDPVDSMVSISVTDDGEGIPQRSLSRIFERFYRADASRARDIGGTGLGLAIVKHLVGAMGGEVEAKSMLGHGTTIRFTLPRADEA